MEKDEVITGCELLIIGGSAGSLKVLMHVLPLLISIPTFAIVIVLHRKNTEDTTLEELIALKSIVPLKMIEDKTNVTPGYIYVAPSNYHLLFEKNRSLSLDISDKVNHSRPSIDVTFESAAEVYKETLVGLLLSGSNADGTEGLQAIQKLGGKIIVQNPTSAEMPFMPTHALKYLKPDYILDMDEIALLITAINL